MLFDYPSSPHMRIHGPAGYTTYKTYKGWLRDEFTFRCVYCLFREVWYPNGEDSFGVDHICPKGTATYTSLKCVYENLLYCCNRCNSNKLERIIADPCKESFAKHLRVQSDGTILALTPEGQLIVRYLKLNSAVIVVFRRKLIGYEEEAIKDPNGPISRVLRDYSRYPSNLPDLGRTLAPANSKREGVKRSHLARKKRNELPETY